jgi:hypothetical protein
MDETWYNYLGEERIQKVYSKFTVKDFWDWWQGDEKKVMEIRIMDFKLIKEIATKHNLPYSASGVYVWSENMLKIVMKEVRDRATCWFGINPRKPNWDKWGRKTFGGTDYHIKQIDVMFIDIDRTEKGRTANSEELGNCDKLANEILDRLKKQGWNKHYIKICSGNGVQLIIKLDIPIMLPQVDFNKIEGGGYFAPSEEFDKMRRLIPEGIGKDITKFANKFKKDLRVEVDKSCFNMGRVAALPYTKNFKYGGFTWRGIVEMESGVNEGFSDYILSKEDNIVNYTQRAVFTSKALKRRDRIKEGQIAENELIKFMLENELPQGMRNNYLWFQVKCLLRDSKIDINGQEFKKIHAQLERKHGTLPANVPEKRFAFDENIVNRYFIDNLIVPLYPIYPGKTKKLDMRIDNIRWDDLDKLDLGIKIEYEEGDSIMDDIINFRKAKILKEGKDSNQEKYISFVKKCIDKYGEKMTKYYFDYVMIKMFTYE